MLVEFTMIPVLRFCNTNNVCPMPISLLCHRLDSGPGLFDHTPLLAHTMPGHQEVLQHPIEGQRGLPSRKGVYLKGTLVYVKSNRVITLGDFIITTLNIPHDNCRFISRDQ